MIKEEVRAKSVINYLFVVKEEVRAAVFSLEPR